jgi:hypothetical protein
MDDGVAVSISQLTLFSVQGWFDVTFAPDATVVTEHVWVSRSASGAPVDKDAMGECWIVRVDWCTTYLKLHC